MRFAALALSLAVVALAVAPSQVSARTVSGIASHVGTQFGSKYLALPEHRWGRPGIRVRICGPAACVVRVSTDAGPDKAMQRAGRVADLNAWDFETVCGCLASRGIVKVKIEYLGSSGTSAGPQPTLPPTDLEDINEKPTSEISRSAYLRGVGHCESSGQGLRARRGELVCS